MAEWPIISDTEYSQSSTFMPWICSVIDGFHVTFPDGYEDLFNATLSGHRVPFTTFKEFQGFLKESVKKTIGNTSSKRFISIKDGDYHLPASLQEAILHLNDPNFVTFFTIFIGKLKKQFAGQKCVLVEHQAERGEAERLAAYRASARADIEAHREAARREAARADIEARREAAHSAETSGVWHFTDVNGDLKPFDEETNEQINLCLEFDQPPIFKTIGNSDYLIDPRAKTQVNLTTKTSPRPIVKKPLQTRPSVKERRWYYMTDTGKKPFSDEDNRKIEAGKSHGYNPIINGYNLNLDGLFQVDQHGNTQMLVYEGGKTKNKKTKRRRSLCKYTRHRY